jgi:pimeloyl-ACP methyl ester carboxylesterase
MRWQHGYPDAKKVIMEGCAHVPAFEQPEVFLSHLMSFLGYSYIR